MAGTVSMTITGSDELRRNLKRLQGAQRLQAQKNGLAAGASIVEAYAKMVVPVDTGALKNSIMVDEVTPTQATIAPHTEYAAAVEFGTSRQAAQPYMRPAIDQHDREIVKAVEDNVAAFLDSVSA